MALITGASKGIGFEVAHQIAKAGSGGSGLIGPVRIVTAAIDTATVARCLEPSVIVVDGLSRHASVNSQKRVVAGWTVLAAASNEERGKQAVARLQGEGLVVHFTHIDLDASETAITAAETKPLS